MRKKFIDQSDIRVNNLKQYISDVYKDEGEDKNKNKKFYNDFKINLKKLKYSDDSIETKHSQLRNALGQYSGKTFSESLELIVERVFNLPKGILSQVRRKRCPSYIFLSCTGNSANIVFTEIQKNKIVDEVVILFGDVDLFIKVYATRSEVQKFITDDLYKIKGVTINRSNTYGSLENKHWVRYPVSKHPDYLPPPDRWTEWTD